MDSFLKKLIVGTISVLLNATAMQQESPFKRLTLQEAEALLQETQQAYNSDSYSLKIQALSNPNHSGCINQAQKLLLIKPAFIEGNDAPISSFLNEDALTETFYHELAHAKDYTGLKHTLGMGAYYLTTLALPLTILYRCQSHIPLSEFNRKLFTSSATVINGIIAYSGNDIINKWLSKHLEKRTDLLAYEYLYRNNKFKALCNRLAYLEWIRRQEKNNSDLYHPTAEEELTYLLDFLEKKELKVSNELCKSTEFPGYRGIVRLYTKQTNAPKCQYNWEHRLN